MNLVAVLRVHPEKMRSHESEYSHTVLQNKLRAGHRTPGQHTKC